MKLSFGQKVKGLREAKGLNLRQLAKLCGIGPPMLSRYEKWQVANPRRDSLISLAKGLEIRVGYLFGDFPDLEDMDTKHVASRESLALFLRQNTCGKDDSKRFLRTLV